MRHARILTPCRSRPALAFVAILATFVVATSCGTTSEGAKPASGRKASAAASEPEVIDQRPENRESGNSLWDQLHQSRVDKDQRIANQQRLEERREVGRAQVPGELRTKLESWWSNFVQLNPMWIDQRELWRKEGPQAANLLVENLIMLMVRAYDVGNGVLYERAIVELVEWSDHAARYLVDGIGQSKSDDVVRQHCVTCLGRIGQAGKPILPALVAAYEAADDVKARNWILRSVARIASFDATPFLVRVVEREKEFQVRIVAIEALGKSLDPRGLEPLVACLADQDISVRKFASGYVGGFKDRRAVGPLVACMKKAEEAALAEPRESEVALNCSSSLRFITGQRFRRSSEWEEWWRQNSGK